VRTILARGAADPDLVVAKSVGVPAAQVDDRDRVDEHGCG